MKKTRNIFLSAGLFISFVSQAQLTLDFQPLADSFEVTNPNAVQAININYDDIEPNKQLFHILLPDTDGNHPLVVFVHGGGFTGGNPGTIFQDANRRATAKYFLDNGFAFASFGYRLISETGPDTEGVIKSLMDVKHALQFVRYYSNDLYIDPDKIALMGTSAGAGTSLWLGTRSEMANPDAIDPILRESTRVSAVVAIASQSTYDIYKWETDIYNNFDGEGTNFTLDSIAEIMTTQRVENFYGGLDSITQIVHDPELIQYREDVDMLFHLSSDDPPVYITSQSPAQHPSDDVLHHSLHGKEIYETALSVNVSEVKAEIPAQLIDATGGESSNEFLLRHLGGPYTGPEQVLGVNTPFQGHVYPNPAHDRFFVNLKNEAVKKVEVLSFSGKLMSSFEDPVQSEFMVTSSMNAGVYLVKITNTDGTIDLKRLIVE